MEWLILGNGTSLNEYLPEIRAKVGNCKIFGVNRVYMLDIPYDYYLAIDKKCWGEFAEFPKNTRFFIQTKYNSLPNVSKITKLTNFNLFKQPFEFNRFVDLCNIEIGHGFSSVYAAIQICLAHNPSKISIYGVDFSLGKNGNTHFYGFRNRTEKSWKLGKQGILQAYNIIKDMKIDVEIYSELFWGKNG